MIKGKKLKIKIKIELWTCRSVNTDLEIGHYSPTKQPLIFVLGYLGLKHITHGPKLYNFNLILIFIYLFLNIIVLFVLYVFLYLLMLVMSPVATAILRKCHTAYSLQSRLSSPWSSIELQHNQISLPNHSDQWETPFSLHNHTLSLPLSLCPMLHFKAGNFSVTQTWNYESLSLSPLLKIPSFSVQKTGCYSLSLSLPLWICCFLCFC